MKYILAGGSGLIGRALAISLRDSGHNPIILSRDPGKQKRSPAGIQLVKWDGRTPEGWGNLVEGTDVVINLAGENLSAGRWSPEQKQAILNSRIYAGAAITKAIQQAQNKPRAVIQISGAGAYGTSLERLFSESDPYGSGFLADVTQAWEGSTQPVEGISIRRVILRTGVVLSKHGGAFSRLALPFKLFAGGPVGSGSQWLSWVHLEDTVRAIRFASEDHRMKGVFNLSAEPVTNRQFATQLGKMMHRPSSLTLPAFFLRLLLGEMSTIILEGQRISSKRLQQQGFIFQYPEIVSALKDLLN